MKEEPYIPVSEVMSRDVRNIDRMATVREAMAAMAKAGVSSLVIKRNSERDELGLLVVTDIAREVIAHNLSPDRVNVYEVMSKPVVTVPADMDIKFAVQLLNRVGISRALVVDEKRDLAGIVTLRDMVLRYADTHG